MKGLKEIHLLVHSLEQSEKRAVTLLGKQMAGTQAGGLLKLFDLINTQKELDVERILKSAEVRAMGKGLPTQLTRLRRLVLKAVTQLQAEKTVASQLSQRMQEIEFLFGRGHLAAALDTIETALTQARAFSYHEISIALLQWRQRIRLEYQPSEVILDEIAQELLSATQGLQALNALKTTHGRMRLMLARTTNTRDLAATADMAQSDLVRTALDSPELHSRFYAMDIAGMHMLITRQGPPALAHYEVLIQQWRAHPQWYRELPDLYLLIFAHYQSAVAFGTLKADAHKAYLNELPDPKHFQRRFQLEFERIRFDHILMLGLNTGKFEVIKAQSPNVLMWIDQNADRIASKTQLTFLHNLAVAFFLFGDFKAANRIVLRILNHNSRDVRMDIRNFARYLQVILQYEMQQHELAEYALRNLKSFQRKKQAQGQFEAALIGFFSAKAGPSQHDSAPDQWEKLEATLLQLRPQISGSLPIIGLNEVLIWVQSKRKGIPIAERFMELVLEVMA